MPPDELGRPEHSTSSQSADFKGRSLYADLAESDQSRYCFRQRKSASRIANLADPSSSGRYGDCSIAGRLRVRPTPARRRRHGPCDRKVQTTPKRPRSQTTVFSAALRQLAVKYRAARKRTSGAKTPIRIVERSRTIFRELLTTRIERKRNRTIEKVLPNKINRNCQLNKPIGLGLPFKFVELKYSLDLRSLQLMRGSRMSFA